MVVDHRKSLLVFVGGQYLVTDYCNAQSSWFILLTPIYRIGKGGKSRKRGKNDNEAYKRELEFKEDGQGRNHLIRTLIGLEYGRVQKMLGNGRVECYCYDGKTRLCNIRGKMRKKVRSSSPRCNGVGVDWRW